MPPLLPHYAAAAAAAAAMLLLLMLITCAADCFSLLFFTPPSLFSYAPLSPICLRLLMPIDYAFAIRRHCLPLYFADATLTQCCCFCLMPPALYSAIAYAAATLAAALMSLRYAVTLDYFLRFLRASRFSLLRCCRRYITDFHAMLITFFAYADGLMI